MLTLFCRHLRGHPADCSGILRSARTTTWGTHGTRACCQQSKGVTHYKHYLRSPYSILHHHYKDLGTLAEAKSFVYNFPRLRGLEETQLDHILKLVKEDGYCWKEVELSKEVLLLTPAEYKHRVQLLQDLSVSQPSLHHVVWTASVMGCTVNALRSSITSIFDSDPLEHLLSAGRLDLKLSESTLQAALDLCRRDDQVTLKHLYLFLLKHYLAARFSEDADSVGAFLDGASLRSLWRPLNHYSRLCDVLIDCLGCSFSEIQDQPRLLFLDPDNTKEILQRFSSMGGVSTKEVVKAHPRLSQIPASHLDSWLRLLHKHQVWKFSYTHHATIMFKSSSFSEVERRLEALQRLQEWEVIMASDRLFEILRSQRHTKRLINAAESGQIISSISLAIGRQEHSGHRQWYGITPEVVSYVALTLDLPPDQVRDLLTDVFTPFGINNTKTVLRLLLDYGFTREQVVAGAMVLNFEAGVVEQTLRDLHSRPEVQPFAEWMENPFMLHLLAYCIKKDIPHLDLPIKKFKLETVDLSMPSSNSRDC
ncbi:uncharacterized protein LOC126981782 isoform X1 [Eriocheir sinensis]|uniref:uncharacterized protein LOC126981782 isoform X1 n=1 Tax=Eriocheir sinensis TaxID=95602 RepID=UPI0021C5E44B|nr:uncharacterized protein LOC126981782 isoform X1 [Eriocheir sinensis]XP_050689285.1 uncharacterized protein LOC126981782 isoform X1 [Eriocheir sinensis]XP_050689286.1 uncharacterized protein LOC126981782 isoform X1 [Eriocheir sinensis]